MDIVRNFKIAGVGLILAVSLSSYLTLDRLLNLFCLIFLIYKMGFYNTTYFIRTVRIR